MDKEARGGGGGGGAGGRGEEVSGDTSEGRERTQRWMTG